MFYVIVVMMFVDVNGVRTDANLLPNAAPSAPQIYHLMNVSLTEVHVLRTEVHVLKVCSCNIH